MKDQKQRGKGRKPRGERAKRRCSKSKKVKKECHHCARSFSFCPSVPCRWSRWKSQSTHESHSAGGMVTSSWLGGSSPASSRRTETAGKYGMSSLPRGERDRSRVELSSFGRCKKCCRACRAKLAPIFCLCCSILLSELKVSSIRLRWSTEGCTSGINRLNSSLVATKSHPSWECQIFFTHHPGKFCMRAHWK